MAFPFSFPPVLRLYRSVPRSSRSFLTRSTRHSTEGRSTGGRKTSGKSEYEERVMWQGNEIGNSNLNIRLFWFRSLPHHPAPLSLTRLVGTPSVPISSRSFRGAGRRAGGEGEAREPYRRGETHDKGAENTRDDQTVNGTSHMRDRRDDSHHFGWSLCRLSSVTWLVSSISLLVPTPFLSLTTTKGTYVEDFQKS